jgi:DNA-binding NtrC family response regulator
MKKNTKIIVIDDLLSEGDIRIKMLKRSFGEDNVFLRKTPQDGVNFVKEFTIDKLIVVLDYQFGENQPTGHWVLEQIREESYVIPVILMTENANNLIQSEFPDFINEKVFAFADKSDYRDLVKKVTEANIELNTQVEVALEEWIERHSPEDKEKPYLTMRSGETYTLNHILKEIRKQTEFGQKMERKILNLAIELLANNVQKL